jgi:hypothetical protein
VALSDPGAQGLGASSDAVAASVTQ